MTDILEDLQRRLRECEADLQSTLMMGFAAAAASDTLRAQRKEAVELLKRAEHLVLDSATKKALKAHPDWNETLLHIRRFVERIEALGEEAE